MSEEQCTKCGLLAYFHGLCLHHYREWRRKKRGGQEAEP